MSSRSEVFSSRWGMLLAMLGMAVGTGNIWRFPRIAASNGGGSFLVAWVVFLLAWSVPLLILEFGLGKATRRGAIGSFVKTLGPGFAWMGAWIAFVATAIMFYYSVVMGWTIRFFVGTLTGEVPGATPSAFWDGFHSTPGAPSLTHADGHGDGALRGVARGVRGIETGGQGPDSEPRSCLVLVLAIRAAHTSGRVRRAGLPVHARALAELADYRIWIEGPSRRTRGTPGRGGGLVLTYAIYMRANEDTALNAFVIGFGNNSMSLLGRNHGAPAPSSATMPDAASEDRRRRPTRG